MPDEQRSESHSEYHSEQHGNGNGHRDRTEKLISLNKLEVILGIIIAVVTLTNSIGSWYVMPYRMNMFEVGLRELRLEKNGQVDLMQKQIDELRTQNRDSRELLVRIEERLKQVQESLHKP